MIEVVAAVIEFEGKLLAFRRGVGKYNYVSNKYEFPGGKVEGEENLKKALSRELFEELNLKAEVSDYLITTEHSYPDFEIKMHCFLVHLSEFNGQLIEHSDFAHVTLNEASKLDWVEADRPILKFLQENCANVFRK